MITLRKLTSFYVQSRNYSLFPFDMLKLQELNIDALMCLYD